MAPKIEAQQRIQSMLVVFQLGLNVMIMVSLLVYGFLAFNTIFMAVKERTYELYVLRAVGTSRRHVFLEESLLLAVRARQHNNNHWILAALHDSMVCNRAGFSLRPHRLFGRRPLPSFESLENEHHAGFTAKMKKELG